MFYTKEITVSANTAEADADETSLPVSHGIITWISFRPRPGHVGLCHCQVFYHDIQICPFTRTEDLHGDTFPIEWNEFIEVFTEPFELRIKSWNEDDTYDHTYDISFVILPKVAVLAVSIVEAIEKMLSQIRDLFSLTTVRNIFTLGGRLG